MAGRCGGVVGRVRVLGHCSTVEDAEGVTAEGGVGVTVFDGGEGFLLGPLTLGFLWRGWLGRCVEVPRRRGQVPEGSRRVEGAVKRVVTASLVGSGGCQDGRCFPSSVVALFICSMGT